MCLFISHDHRFGIPERLIQSFQVLRNGIALVESIIFAALNAAFRIKLTTGNETGIIIGNGTRFESHRRLSVMRRDGIL